jgi:hypothetical protein
MFSRVYSRFLEYGSPIANYKIYGVAIFRDKNYVRREL